MLEEIGVGRVKRFTEGGVEAEVLNSSRVPFGKRVKCYFTAPHLTDMEIDVDAPDFVEALSQCSGSRRPIVGQTIVMFLRVEHRVRNKGKEHDCSRVIGWDIAEPWMAPLVPQGSLAVT